MITALSGVSETTVPEAEWLNRTINIDTGCIFENKLTALSLPHKILYQVPRGKLEGRT